MIDFRIQKNCHYIRQTTKRNGSKIAVKGISHLLCSMLKVGNKGCLMQPNFSTHLFTYILQVVQFLNST